MRLASSIKRFGKKLEHPVIASALGSVLGTIIGGAAFYAYWYNEWRHLPPSTAPIRELIASEARLAKEHNEADLVAYRDLFVPEASVRDVVRNINWDGQFSVVNRVRPLAFSELLHTPTEIVMSEDGTAFARTVTLFRQVKPDAVDGHGSESWQFVETKDGQWKIISLEFDFPENGVPQ